jgi:chromosome segregation ATPase
MKKISTIFIFFILTSLLNIYSKNSDPELSSLHNKISKDLLTLKKDFPSAQTKVYSLLDQVCKIYQIGKNTIKKKKIIKNKLILLEKENQTLIANNHNLDKKLNKIKENFLAKTKELEKKNKVLTQNTAVLTIINKEKQAMENEINKLKEEQKQLLLKAQSEKINNDQALNQNTPIEQNEYQENIAQLQSVNLTSTWAPSSPL